MNTVIVSSTEENYAMKVQTGEGGEHIFVADEPTKLGGKDQGPNPYDLLLSALGTCTAITLQMYAQRKGWPLVRVEIRLRHERIHAQDCADCETQVGRIEQIHREILLEGPLSREQRRRMLEIASHCPVHRTLEGEIKIRDRELIAPR